MNEIIQSALASALTAVEEALAAAQAGNPGEARQLLAIMEEHLEQGQGGNAAHAARRKKILRLEAETRALLPQLEVEATAPETEVAPQESGEATPAGAPASLPLPAPELPVMPLPAAEAPVTPAEPAAAVLEATPPAGKAPRGVAPPQHLPAEGWAQVGAALRLLGADAADLDAVAARHEAAMQAAGVVRDRYRVKVEERLMLQARVEAAALRGDVDAANRAWDRLFDVVTAIRGAEGKARRSGTPDAGKAADYEAAREGSLKIRQWARTVQAA